MLVHQQLPRTHSRCPQSAALQVYNHQCQHAQRRAMLNAGNNFFLNHLIILFQPHLGVQKAMRADGMDI